MYEAILLSLKITGISTLITSFLGIITAYIFNKHDFRGKSILETLFLMPIALPPTVVGYLIMLGIGRKSVFGQFLYKNFGINILFTWQAACIAAIVVSFPLIYQNAKKCFQICGRGCKRCGKSGWCL